MKKLEKLTNIIEAILFASGDAVPIDLLREKLEVGKRHMDEAIKSLEKKYAGDCGIRLLHFNHKLQFATNPDFKDPVSLVLTPIREKEFTRTILECAAIIAYKQPITRTELETIRGVNSDYAIQTLMNLEMIYPSGRRETAGKPVEYSTTDNFLKRFKLKSLSELPDYQELMQRIAALNAINEPESNYLYEKDVYDPENDPEYFNENVGEEELTQPEQKTEGFELPDFLKDIEDGIIKIQ
ncbi:MAG: SMC-Scp complex subunit ScpB [Clostridiales bacterium]|nr:SMC-Scp complex subunit ScpB [Clostridiales bacterium]